MRKLFRPFRAPLFLTCLAVAFGCGGKGASLHPVSGTVTVGGQPLSGGQVTFTPTATKEKDAEKAGLSAGTIDANGKYTILTDGKSGAPLGTYNVTVSPSMVPVAGKSPTTFNPKYSSVTTTTLHVEVTASPEAGHYDLKLDK